MDDLQRSLLNVFATSDLDRVVPLRKDHAWFEQMSSNESSRYIPFHKGRFLVNGTSEFLPAWMRFSELGEFTESIQVKVLLGLRDSVGFFAVDIGDERIVERYSSDSCKFADLRECGSLLRPEDASVLSFAKALFHWHRAHRFCGFCGSETVPAQAGHVRECSDRSCGRSHFPRTDPAIIVAVMNKDRCLFGRQSSWAPKRYSVIAGFVEPGETIEQAVVREVMEETNIRIKSVKYRSSQPWPFPGSVMLGFSAVADSMEISLNDGELQEAHWRSVEQVVEGLFSGQFRLPPQLSIAYRLIEEWFDSHYEEPLTQFLDRTGLHSTLIGTMRN